MITGRTVATHVEHILNKLGFASGTQIGVWAVEHGLLPPSGATRPLSQPASIGYGSYVYAPAPSY